MQSLFVLFCFFTSSERHIGFYLSFLSSFERNIGGPGACYKVLAELICFVVVFCVFFSSSYFERNIGGPGVCYKVLAELSPGFADTGPPRGVSTGGKQIAPRYTNIHLYFIFAIRRKININTSGSTKTANRYKSASQQGGQGEGSRNIRITLFFFFFGKCQKPLHRIFQN